MASNQTATTRPPQSPSTDYDDAEDEEGRLQEAGLVESELVVNLDGHHHEEFYAVVERADISLSCEGVDIAITPDEDSGDDADG
ncbi:hypothetical protein BRC73_07305 [Halobacteriales archaeon QH_7_66_37]|nr:MAG: hypothetical protein BRC73_07305 [Halobacteriales archaeon QH_7_66_37]